MRGLQPLPWHRETLAALNRMPSTHHALLLTSPDGHGLAELALTMAAGWLCDHPSAGVACAQCESCHWWRAGVHPDFQHVTPESPEDATDTLVRQEIKIGAIRAFGDWATGSAHRARKAVVIEPADVMNLAASNALLKLLEEPPLSMRFFLASRDARRLPATIVSRCLRVAVAPAQREEAKTWLSAQNVPTAQLDGLLAQAGGAPMSALALAEGDIQVSRESFLGALSTPLALSALALGDALDGVSRADRRSALKSRLNWLLLWVYDLLVCASGGSPRFNPDYNTVINGIAKNFPKVAGFRYYANLIERIETVQHPLNPRLVLEDALIEYKRLTTVGT